VKLILALRLACHSTARIARHFNEHTDIAHTPLVSEHDFLTARTVDTEHRDTEHGKHAYALSGRLRCALCGRRVDSAAFYSPQQS
jgi:hypothetical protein